MEGLAEVEDRRTRLHLRRHDLVLLWLAPRRPQVAAGDDPRRAVLGREVAEGVQHDDLELRYVRGRHGVSIRRDRRVDPSRVVTMEVLHGLLGHDLDQLRRAEEVVEARRQEVVVGDVERTLVLQELDERLRLAGQPVDPMRLRPMKSISIGMWFGVPGSEAASSSSKSALSLDSSSGPMASSTIAQPSRSMASISDSIETSGPKRSMCGSSHVGSVHRVA